MSHGLDYGDIFVFALATALLLLAVHSGFGLLLKSRNVEQWRSVEGHLEYLYEYDTYSHGPMHGTRYAGTNLDVQYTYTYGAAQFKGKYVTVLDFPPRLWCAQYINLFPRLKDAYINKKPISVLVNPEAPHQSVLAIVPVRWSVCKAVAMLLIGGLLLIPVHGHIPSAASSMYGAIVGITVYLLFAVGLLVTWF